MRRAFDNYPTPRPIADWVVERCLKIEDRVKGARDITFLEPGCGDDAPFLQAAQAFGVNDATGFDVREVSTREGRVRAGRDIFKHYPGSDDRWDVVATNPPFSVAFDFVRHCVLELMGDRGVSAFVLRLAFLESQKRRRWFGERPPFEVAVMSQRPSFTTDGKTDTSAIAVFFWTGRKITDRSCPRLSWVPREVEKQCREVGDG